MEIVEKIEGQMSIADMVAYGGTSSENYVTMHNAIVTRVETAIRTFTPDYTTFMQMLIVHHVVISGSVALWVFLPSSEWKPNDMDLYVPCRRVHGVLRCLRSLGYIPVKRPDAIVRETRYSSRSAIASVTKVTNGDISIDVIESKSPSPFVPIFKFHITAVMNFISADGFFAAYPTLTTKRRAIFNSLRLPNGVPSTKTLLCYKKYRERGYELAFTSVRWSDDEHHLHVCQRSSECPQTIRSTFDPGCLFTSLRIVDKDNIVEDVVTPRCFEDRRAVVWHVGGESCYGDRESLRPFRVWRAGYI